MNASLRRRTATPHATRRSPLADAQKLSPIAFFS
jgi:hypothetical protein